MSGTAFPLKIRNNNHYNQNKGYNSGIPCVFTQVNCDFVFDMASRFGT